MGGRIKQCAEPGTVLTPFIDVSKFQGHVNWPQVKADPQQIQMAIARATVGGSQDSQFATNWAGMKAAGLIRGAYIGFHPLTSARVHCDAIVKALVGFERGVDAPPVIDIEKLEDVVQPVGTGPEDVDALLDRAIELVTLIERELRVQPWIYTGAFWQAPIASTRPARAGTFSTLPLWTPHYGVVCPGLPKGWSRWTMWQHSSTGHAQGIAGNLDMSWFRGSRAELVALIQRSSTVC